MILLLALLLQFPTSPSAPPQTCTASGLKLSTKAMTQDEAWQAIHQKFGSQAWQQYKGNTVMLGFTILGWGMEIKPDPSKCPSQNCWKNTNGSWRSAWNSIAISECQRRQVH